MKSARILLAFWTGSARACIPGSALPFRLFAGAPGYFAYDLKSSIESLPTSAADDLDLPDLFIFWPAQIEVYDREERRLSRIAVRPDGGNTLKEEFPRPFFSREQTRSFARR